METQSISNDTKEDNSVSVEMSDVPLDSTPSTVNADQNTEPLN